VNKGEMLQELNERQAEMLASLKRVQEARVKRQTKAYKGDRNEATKERDVDYYYIR